MPSGRRRLTLQQKDTLRAYYHSKPQGTITLALLVEWATNTFGCSIHLSTAHRIVHDKRAAEAFNIEPGASNNRCNLKHPKHPNLDNQLATWVKAANSSNVCITGPMLKQKALRIAKALGLDAEFRASQGWLNKFQRRHNFWVHRLHGESASVDPVVADTGRKSLLLETQLYEPTDVYNIDETAIFYKAQPKTSMSSQRIHGLKKDKSRISVGLAANADGSHKLPPLFIGKAARPRCFGTLSASELRLYYRSNRKAWMTVALFSEWILQLNNEMKSQDRRILLLLDNASSHQVVRTDISHVRVVMLPPNTTSVLQPMDAGIISTFKQYYKNRQLDHAISIVDHITAGVEVSEQQRKNPYAVDVLQAMQWSTQAWNDVSATTIRNCWAHTGILPQMSLTSALGSLRVGLTMSVNFLLS
ncbi:Aste57867_23934 [Aphanomyces stellatus]|uniref:Aste57867_23934 protein n=1 Tax=Aphanomyces stellatus TaxID=120398 RepID=A0A485LP45_9STRA|nr:hypothetical protein As57867_023861 [Aphanomyces stellatus]VFU00577.1 Aste57867_23934 [Aphanomyces stellatus]